MAVVCCYDFRQTAKHFLHKEEWAKAKKPADFASVMCIIFFLRLPGSSCLIFCLKSLPCAYQNPRLLSLIDDTSDDIILKNLRKVDKIQASLGKSSEM